MALADGAEHVRSRGVSGHDQMRALMSAYDPKRTLKALSRPAGPSPSSPEHRPLGLREGQRGDERDGCADRDIPEEPAAVADGAEPLDDQRSGAAE